MKRLLLVFAVLLAGLPASGQLPERTTTLEKGWRFALGDDPAYAIPSFDDSGWRAVTLPHDWAISDIKPEGTGWYRIRLDLGDAFREKLISLEFEGAMSNAQVFVNGRLVAEHPYGYTSFEADLTSAVKHDGNDVVAVRLHNPAESSRWYTGAGLYRKVNITVRDKTSIPDYGVFVSTLEASPEKAVLSVSTTVNNKTFDLLEATVRTTVTGLYDKVAATAIHPLEIGPAQDNTLIQSLTVSEPLLWGPSTPILYTAVSELYLGERLIDTYTTTFGIRTVELDPSRGVLVNGVHIPLKGVCLHHDLGPLGAAVNRSATVRQLEIMREMGANAVRTSHNPPSKEFLEVCDSMGMLVIEECFDEWRTPKTPNGYARHFDTWGELDLVSMIRRDRNHPCIIAWSIGNEIPDMTAPHGAVISRFLSAACRREDPLRPVTAGLDRPLEAIKAGSVNPLDIIGLNYKPHLYKQIREQFPDKTVLGSETASTVSSRGVYYQPRTVTKEPSHPDNQCSSYDVECMPWSNLPDEDLAAAADLDFLAGEMVWTGFDYIGEPSPYMAPGSPSRSSYFGIVDLAGMKKDRFYLYQSVWTDKPVLRLMPHWNWESGQTVAVQCYTNYPEVELRVNGRSMGRRKLGQTPEERFRLVWDSIVYRPGKIEAVAYDKNGKKVAQTAVKTAGKPARIRLIPEPKHPRADGRDLAWVEVVVTDGSGTPVPFAANELTFKVTGGELVALCNGDSTCPYSFTGTVMPAFSGRCMAIVKANDYARPDITLSVKSPGLKEGKAVIHKLKPLLR